MTRDLESPRARFPMERARLLDPVLKTRKAPEGALSMDFPEVNFPDEKMERAKGFEPSTPTLARLCSTPELHPHAPSLHRTQKWNPLLGFIRCSRQLASFGPDPEGRVSENRIHCSARCASRMVEPGGI